MPAGRPPKYNASIVKKAKEYINAYESYGDAIPSVSGLAVVLGVRRETLHVWAKDERKEDFSNILDALLAVQEKVLVNGGLNGDMNATIVKLVLGKHGYSEKTEQGFDPDKPLNTNMTVTFVDEGQDSE